MGTRTATTRRSFIAVAGLAAAGLAVDAYAGHRPQRAALGLLRPASPPRARPPAGPQPRIEPNTVLLLAAPANVDLGGRTVRAWTFNGQLPGPELRLRAGQVVRVRLENRLPAGTTVHWHGIALRNDMDGVPGVTQPPVLRGQGFDYQFTVPDPGTYFYHPHVGLQVDRGLYGPLVVEDPGEVVDYDGEAVLVLDDWTIGVGPTPEQFLARLQQGGMHHQQAAGGSMAGMGGMHHGAGQMTTGDSRTPLGADAGDVRHPLYLINGRSPRAPAVLKARPGQRMRLRIINAAADTAFRLAVGGHRLTVIHADGFPIRPVTGDALLIAMGERYDIQVELGDGVFPLVALAEGKGAQAVAVVRTSRGEAPRPGVHPSELDRWLLTAADLDADGAVDLGRRSVVRTHRLVLDGDMRRYRWTINGRAHHHGPSLPVRDGERVRLLFENRSPMWHPMHLHGHTFQLRRPRQPASRAAQGHRDRAAGRAGYSGVRRRQPRPLDGALPQRLPPGGWHDDHTGLPVLTPPAPRQLAEVRRPCRRPGGWGRRAAAAALSTWLPSWPACRPARLAAVDRRAARVAMGITRIGGDCLPWTPARACAPALAGRRRRGCVRRRRP